MNLPTPFSIGVRKPEVGATDAHGNAVTTYAEPISVSVYSVAPTFSNEPFEAGRDAVVTGYSVLAPSEVQNHVNEDCLVVLNGDEFTVEGEVASWDSGPFGWTPGVAILLKRVEG